MGVQVTGSYWYGFRGELGTRISGRHGWMGVVRRGESSGTGAFEGGFAVEDGSGSAGGERGCWSILEIGGGGALWIVAGWG